MAADPKGKRSYNNTPKLGGPTALLDSDPGLASEMKAYADMDAKKRPSLNKIARLLKTKRRTWTVRSGANKGSPWPAKQIFTFLRKYGAAKAKGKAKAKAKVKAKVQDVAKPKSINMALT